MPPTCKFSRLDTTGKHAPFSYDGLWAVQRTSGPDRLVVAPGHGEHVNVLLELARCLPEPFGILYVLVVPRTGEHSSGRYQSPAPTSLEETETFVRRFAPFFEGDGRHHLWLMSLPAKATLVYDNHDLIYAYGPADKYKAVLESRGLRQGNVGIPAPHQHCYNVEFDDAERDLMSFWEWLHFPLQPDDDP